jgi:nitroreductase
VEFIIVRDRGTKEELAAAALGQTFIAEAPVVIAVCSNTRRSAAVYGSRGVDFYSIIDGAFAAMTILLSAVNEGLGCCFVAAFRDEDVSRVLGLPPHVRPIGLMPLGYRAERPARASRIPLDRLVHDDRW